LKKIVILHPAHWRQQYGGAENQIKLLIELLLERKFEVHYIFLQDGSHSVSGINLHGLEFIKIPGLGDYTVLTGAKVFSLLKKIKPDVIYTRSYTSWNGIASYYAKSRKVKHIYAVASDKHVEQINIKNRWWRLFDSICKFSNLYAFRNSSTLVTQNIFQSGNIRHLYNRESLKITQLSRIPDRQYLSSKCYDVINILWVANFKPLKQPELFKELARRIRSNKSYKLIMVGRLGNNYRREDWIDPYINLEYHGCLSNEDVGILMDRSHLLVNTSLYEGFSNTFVEAWMRSVPVLSLNSNPDGIITNYGIGFVSSDVEDLAALVRQLIEEPVKLMEMGKRAKAYAELNHSIEANEDKILTLFN
jgi:glycosyltransferase involved in cell wall biosynthesis